LQQTHGFTFADFVIPRLYRRECDLFANASLYTARIEDVLRVRAEPLKPSKRAWHLFMLGAGFGLSKTMFTTLHAADDQLTQANIVSGSRAANEANARADNVSNRLSLGFTHDLAGGGAAIPHGQVWRKILPVESCAQDDFASARQTKSGQMFLITQPDALRLC
jgi:hypothetical protein